MDENLNCKLHLHFQVPEDSNSIWPYREIGRPTRLLTDLTNNCVECNVTSLDLSHLDRIQNSRRQKENCISFEKTGRVGGNDNEDGTENGIPCSHCKPNIGILTRGGEDSKIHVQCLSPLQENIQKGNDKQHQISNTVESKHDKDAIMGLTYCPNFRIIKSLQASFGKLCQIGNMESVMWENKLCRLVLPHPNPAQEVGPTSYDQELVSIISNCGKNDISSQGCSDSLMVVETFVREQDLIGEVDYGMVFMDCYGRLFHWEDACQILWPRESDDGLPWFVDDDGNIQIIIDHFTEKPNMKFTDEAEDEEQDDEVLEESDQNNVLEVLPPKESTTPISLAHISNSSNDFKKASLSNLLEAEDNYYKMILEDCVKNCAYFDSIPQSVKEMNEKMPDDSDDDGYSRCNEYSECDRALASKIADHKSALLILHTCPLIKNLSTTNDYDDLDDLIYYDDDGGGGGREKSKIMKPCKPFLINYRNITYNILKYFKDDMVENKEISELEQCSEYTNNILTSPIKNTVQKKCTQESTAKKSSSKKKKDDVSTMLKKLIKELLTNTLDIGKVLKEINALDTSSNTGTYSKDGKKVLVEEEVRKQIPETKFSDEVL
ncbi:hypothetical protein C1646_762440 [Rhizophagus diaphanus]|nr:hypothetical protein C1646_762440 [Rhizophagus diaphanus] [Rhizophagus sp. MUCL 43196]